MDCDGEMGSCRRADKGWEGEMGGLNRNGAMGRGRWGSGQREWGRWRGGNGTGEMAKGAKGRGRGRGKRRVDFRDGYDKMRDCNEVAVFSGFVYPCNAGYPS